MRERIKGKILVAKDEGDVVMPGANQVVIKLILTAGTRTRTF